MKVKVYIFVELLSGLDVVDVVSCEILYTKHVHTSSW